MRHFALIVIVAFLVLTSACTEKEDQVGMIQVGAIKVFSDGIEYSPIENWVSSYCDGLAADGAYLLPWEVNHKLDAIPYNDDFEVEIVGANPMRPKYTLYRSDAILGDSNTKIYSNSDMLEIPIEQGEYIVSVHVVWSNGMSKNKYKSEGYQYLFKISVE